MVERSLSQRFASVSPYLYLSLFVWIYLSILNLIWPFDWIEKMNWAAFGVFLIALGNGNRRSDEYFKAQLHRHQSQSETEKDAET